MRLQENKKHLGLAILISLIAAISLASCGGGATGPDFSTVPDPFDTIPPLAVTFEDTFLIFYDYHLGEGNQTAIIRDQITYFFTKRALNGEVEVSTYANGRTTPDIITLTSTQLDVAIRRGFVGMRPGGRRKVVDLRGDPFRNFTKPPDSSIYYLELVEILSN